MVVLIGFCQNFWIVWFGHLTNPVVIFSLLKNSSLPVITVFHHSCPPSTRKTGTTNSCLGDLVQHHDRHGLCAFGRWRGNGMGNGSSVGVHWVHCLNPYPHKKGKQHWFWENFPEVSLNLAKVVFVEGRNKFEGVIETITRCKCNLVYSVASSASCNAQHATEEIDMDNLDQGFFASGLDSFDMGVIQNRFAKCLGGLASVKRRQWGITPGKSMGVWFSWIQPSSRANSLSV